MRFPDILLLAAAIFIALPILVLFAECLAASLLPACPARTEVPRRGRVAVLIPAHDEEAVIARTIGTLRPQLRDGDSILVVADNCSDGTAAAARAAGAAVAERRDEERRGKGYALDFGVGVLRQSPPDVVLLVDADCDVEEGAVDTLVSLACLRERPIQALNLLGAADLSPTRQVSAFAFLVKNLVRPTGLDRFGLPVMALGTGIAFPWSVLEKIDLASANIVEDIQMGIDAAISGRPFLFSSDARVSGRLPTSGEAARSQRTRWEHGHIQTLLSQVPRLMGQAIRQRRADLAAMALDLAVPPLTLLCLLWAMLLVSAGVSAALGGAWLPLAITGVNGLLLFLALLVAWLRFGRGVIPGKVLLFVPLYAAWKIPIYLAFFTRRQREWVRTERDQPGHHDHPPGGRGQ